MGLIDFLVYRYKLTWLQAIERTVKPMVDLIIIGAGCAGLTSAIYAIRAGLSVVVFEKGMYGGQISVTNEVENYPSIEKISGPDLSNKIYEQAVKLGADIRFEEVFSVELEGAIKQVNTQIQSYQAKAVIIANGVERRKIDCKGEDEFAGKGVSYCATCDGAFFKKQPVAIVGGGNTALEDALFLSNVCSKVTIIHRRDAFTAQKILVDSINNRENIEIRFNTTVSSIEGENMVKSMTINDTKTNLTETIGVTGVFVAIGLKPDNATYETVGLDKSGYIIADENCTTRFEGVYVAGDTRTKLLRQIVTAVSDGATAAFQAANFINTHN
ncbi:MAG: thioredoxin-disulfide reductase [Oscillospiraceae bacterium]